MISTGKNRFFIETFGCQMNVNDSEKVSGLLQASGWEEAPSKEEADFVFVNTCAVRERAQEKLFHSLGRLSKLKRSRPRLVVGVGGCVAQLQGTDIRRRATVDLLVGTRSFARIPELLKRFEAGERELTDLTREVDEVPASIVAHSSSVRAYVTAIEGCNHVCSFCVVPRTRGAEVCRAPEAIVREVESLVERGYPEVMLLGQTVNAYRHGDVDFPALLKQVGALPGLKRLRFTTSHPAHVRRGLIEAFASVETLCPYLHLPVQSGSNRILARMRRGYTREQYLETVGDLRRSVPGLAITTDIIVGYPGEEEKDFEETMDLLERVGFDGLFCFAYSRRPGTTAFREGDPVSEEEKKRRIVVLNSHQQRRQALRHELFVGKRVEVLVDTITGPGRLSGRTRDFRIVHSEGDETLLGRLVEIEIASSGANSISGRIRASH